MRKLSTLALGAALSLAALPALAQTSGSGTVTTPGTSTTPNNSSNQGSGTGSSTTITNEQAPPAVSGSGSRALSPGQNPDGTPRQQTPGNGPELPGMNGGQGR